VLSANHVDCPDAGNECRSVRRSSGLFSAVPIECAIALHTAWCAIPRFRVNRVSPLESVSFPISRRKGILITQDFAQIRCPIDQISIPAAVERHLQFDWFLLVGHQG